MRQVVRKLHTQTNDNLKKFILKISRNSLNSDDINIETKHILEDMQSVLDYIAVDIHNNYCPEHKLKKIYFQYTKENESEQDFIKKVNKNFPDLYNNNINVYNVLSKFQSFNDNSNWIIKLNDLSNEVKHNDLYINTIEEIKNTTLKNNNTSLMIEGNSKLQKSGDRYGVFGTGSVYVSGNERVNFYNDGIVGIGNGTYNANTGELNNIEKNVTIKNVVKSKKYNENIIDILNLIINKEEQLISELEMYF